MRAARVWPRTSVMVQLKIFRAASLQPVIFPLRSADKTAIPLSGPTSGTGLCGGPCGCELGLLVASRAFGVDLATVNNGWIEYAASNDHESNLAPWRAGG